MPTVLTQKRERGHSSDGIDAVFELVGPVGACYVRRAWNAARISWGNGDMSLLWDDVIFIYGNSPLAGDKEHM